MHDRQRHEIHRFLSAGSWFGGLPAALQDLILARSAVRHYAKGQVISIEDSVPKGLYAVLEGQVHLVRDVGTGEEALIQICEPGYWFGALALLNGSPTAVTAIAHSAVRALLLPKARFERILEEEPRHYPAIARLELGRFASLLRIFAEVQGLEPEARLRGRLAAMAGLRLQERPADGPPSLAVSQADLARMVGVSRQTLNALLGKLRDEGAIEIGFRRIRVLDGERLAGAAAEHTPPRRGNGARRRAAREAARPRGPQV